LKTSGNHRRADADEGFIEDDEAQVADAMATAVISCARDRVQPPRSLLPTGPFDQCSIYRGEPLITSPENASALAAHAAVNRSAASQSSPSRRSS
jgi:hypothetical protein